MGQMYFDGIPFTILIVMPMHLIIYQKPKIDPLDTPLGAIFQSKREVMLINTFNFKNYYMDRSNFADKFYPVNDYFPHDFLLPSLFSFKTRVFLHVFIVCFKCNKPEASH